MINTLQQSKCIQRTVKPSLHHFEKVFDSVEYWAQEVERNNERINHLYSKIIKTYTGMQY